VGIGLGAQQIARVLGARVGPHPHGQVEIGYTEVRPTAHAGWFLDGPTAFYQWHGEGFEIPASGGDTWFCNMYEAYEAMPDALKQRVATLTCKHDSSHNSAGETRKGFADGFKSREDIPGAIHPLVCTHPGTQHPVLYLGRRENAYIVELPEADSDALLDELWSYTTKKDNTYSHRWQVGDVLMWDNRCTMHRRDDFDPESRRIMHRSQVKGTAMAAFAA